MRSAARFGRSRASIPRPRRPRAACRARCKQRHHEQVHLVAVGADHERHVRALLALDRLARLQRHQRHRRRSARNRGRARRSSVTRALRLTMVCAGMSHRRSTSCVPMPSFRNSCSAALRRGLARRERERRAALRDRAVEQAVRRGRDEQRAHRVRAGRLAEDRHVVRVAAEALDVGLHPAQRRDLIALAEVRRGVVALAAERAEVAVAERAEAIVDRHDHDVAALAQRSAVVDRHRAAAGRERRRRESRTAPAGGARRAPSCTRSDTGSPRSAALRRRRRARRTRPAPRTPRTRARSARRSTARAPPARRSAACRPAVSRMECRETPRGRRAFRLRPVRTAFAPESTCGSPESAASPV